MKLRIISGWSEAFWYGATLLIVLTLCIINLLFKPLMEFVESHASFVSILLFFYYAIFLLQFLLPIFTLVIIGLSVSRLARKRFREDVALTISPPAEFLAQTMKKPLIQSSTLMLFYFISMLSTDWRVGGSLRILAALMASSYIICWAGGFDLLWRLCRKPKCNHLAYNGLILSLWWFAAMFFSYALYIGNVFALHSLIQARYQYFGFPEGDIFPYKMAIAIRALLLLICLSAAWLLRNRWRKACRWYYWFDEKQKPPKPAA